MKCRILRQVVAGSAFVLCASLAAAQPAGPLVANLE